MLLHLGIQLFISQVIILLRENKCYNIIKFISLLRATFFHIGGDKL